MQTLNIIRTLLSFLNLKVTSKDTILKRHAPLQRVEPLQDVLLREMVVLIHDWLILPVEE